MPAEAAPAPGAPVDSLPTWEAVILHHLDRYPQMGMGDLYKLLHQGALGSEHAVEDETRVREWLAEELAVMGTARPEAVVDTIAPNGTHVRIHLRPYVTRGGDTEALLEAFIETANAGTASEEALEAALAAALRLAEEGTFRWNAESLASFFAAQREAGFPAEHHSRGYWSLYRPAYRVVSGDRVGVLLETLRKEPGH